jgi:COMPASS component SWD3
MTFSEDLKNFFSASVDRSVKIWETDTGLCTKTLTGHKASVTSLDVSPMGILATGGLDEKIFLWRIEDGTNLALLNTTFPVFHLKFSSDNDYLFAGGFEGEFLVFDLKNGNTMNISEVASNFKNFSLIDAYNRQNLLAVGFGNKIKIFDRNNKFLLLKTLTYHDSLIKSLVMSPDGNLLASSTLNETKLWNITSNEEVAIPTSFNWGAISLDFSLDGKYLYFGSIQDEALNILEIDSGRIINSFKNNSIMRLKNSGKCLTCRGSKYFDSNFISCGCKKDLRVKNLHQCNIFKIDICKNYSGNIILYV